MSGDDIDVVIHRLDRLERKLDELAIRYERHEAQSLFAERSALELRRFLYAVATGVSIAALTGVGGLLVAIAKLLNGG